MSRCWMLRVIAGSMALVYANAAAHRRRQLLRVREDPIYNRPHGQRRQVTEFGALHDTQGFEEE